MYAQRLKQTLDELLQSIPDDDYVDVRAIIDLIKRRGDALRAKTSKVVSYMDDELRAEISTIVAALQSDDLTIRRLVSLAIDENDGDWDLRDDITRHIAKLRSAGAGCTYYLIQLLETSDDPYILHRAATAAAYIGPEAAAAANALGKVLRRPTREYKDSRTIGSAGYALGCLGQSGHDVLCQALKDEDNNVRMSASISLSNIRGVASPAISCLIDALQDKDPCVRRSIGESFVSMGSVGVLALVDLLERSGSPTTEEVLNILAGIGTEAHAAAEAVRRLLDDSYAAIRLLAAETLCRIDPQNRLGTARLIEELVQRETEKERNAALSLVKEYGHRASAIGTLQTLASSRQPRTDVRLRALEALNTLEPDKADAALSHSKEMQWEAEGVRLRKQLVLFVNVIRMYDKKGADSFTKAAALLSEALDEGLMEGTGSICKEGVSRCVKKLTLFFSKVLIQENLQLFDKPNGFRARPTAACRAAVDWTERFLKRHPDKSEYQSRT